MTELAGSGGIHQRFPDHGYTTSGNSHTLPVPNLAVPGGPVPELTVDLLNPPSTDTCAPRNTADAP